MALLRCAGTVSETRLEIRCPRTRNESRIRTQVSLEERAWSASAAQESTPHPRHRECRRAAQSPLPRLIEPYDRVFKYALAILMLELGACFANTARSPAHRRVASAARTMAAPVTKYLLPQGDCPSERRERGYRCAQDAQYVRSHMPRAGPTADYQPARVVRTVISVIAPQPRKPPPDTKVQ